MFPPGFDSFSFGEYSVLGDNNSIPSRDFSLSGNPQNSEWYATKLTLLTSVEMLRRRNSFSSPDNQVTDVYNFLNQEAKKRHWHREQHRCVSGVV